MQLSYPPCKSWGYESPEFRVGLLMQLFPQIFNKIRPIIHQNMPFQVKRKFLWGGSLLPSSDPPPGDDWPESIGVNHGGQVHTEFGVGVADAIVTPDFQKMRLILHRNVRKKIFWGGACSPPQTPHQWIPLLTPNQAFWMCLRPCPEFGLGLWVA